MEPIGDSKHPFTKEASQPSYHQNTRNFFKGWQQPFENTGDMLRSNQSKRGEDYLTSFKGCEYAFSKT